MIIFTTSNLYNFSFLNRCSNEVYLFFSVVHDCIIYLMIIHDIYRIISIEYYIVYSRVEPMALDNCNGQNTDFGYETHAICIIIPIGNNND